MKAMIIKAACAAVFALVAAVFLAGCAARKLPQASEAQSGIVSGKPIKTPGPAPTVCPGSHGMLLLVFIDDKGVRNELLPYCCAICSSVYCEQDTGGDLFGVEMDGMSVYDFLDNCYDELPVTVSGTDFEAELPNTYSCRFDEIRVWRLGAPDEAEPIRFNSVDELKEYASDSAAWSGADELLAEICVKYSSRYWTDGVHVGNADGIDGYGFLIRQ